MSGNAGGYIFAVGNKTETENRLKLILEELGEFAQNTQIIPFSVQNSVGAEKLRSIIEEVIVEE